MGLFKKQPKNSVASSDARAYMDEARDWETSQVVNERIANRRSWLVARMFFAIAVLAVLAVVGLTPLHRVVPHWVFVDKLTGETQVASALADEKTATINESVDMNWSTRYVTTREGYYYPLLQRDYDFVLATSTDEIAGPYKAIFDGRESKEKRLGNSRTEKVKVISVRLGESNQAIVDYEVETRRADTGSLIKDAERFTATVKFEYKPPRVALQKDRIENPLGFRVIGYRVDAQLAKPTDVRPGASSPPTSAAAAPVAEQSAPKAADIAVMQATAAHVAPPVAAATAVRARARANTKKNPIDLP